MAEDITTTIEDAPAGSGNGDNPINKLPGNWKNNRLWVRSDQDFRCRLEQVASRINRNISVIMRDGAERELEFLMANHPRLRDFELIPLDEWLKVRPNKIG